MASILKYFNAQSTRYNSAKKRLRTEDNQAVVAATSSILYVGNLSFVTTEQQILEVFRRCGAVKKIVMGLNRETKKPCGFCFVMYYRRDSLVAAMNYLNGTKLDNRHIRLQVDKGFREGRQYGRGASGGQVRDELRADFDAGRGGHGVLAAQNAMLDRNRGEHKQSMAEFTADYTGRTQHEAEHGSGGGQHGGDKRGRHSFGGGGGRGRGRGRGRGGGHNGHRRHSGEHRGHGDAGSEAFGREGYKRSREY